MTEWLNWLTDGFKEVLGNTQTRKAFGDFKTEDWRQWELPGCTTCKCLVITSHLVLRPGLHPEESAGKLSDNAPRHCIPAYTGKFFFMSRSIKMLKSLQPRTPLMRLHRKKTTQVKEKSYRSGDSCCFITHVGVKSWKPPECSAAGNSHIIYSMGSKHLLKSLIIKMMIHSKIFIECLQYAKHYFRQWNSEQNRPNNCYYSVYPLVCAVKGSWSNKKKGDDSE